MFVWPVFLAVKTEGGFRFDTRSGHASIDSQRGNHVLLERNVEKIRYPQQNVRSLDGGGSFEIQEKWGKVEGSRRIATYGVCNPGTHLPLKYYKKSGTCARREVNGLRSATSTDGFPYALRTLCALPSGWGTCVRDSPPAEPQSLRVTRPCRLCRRLALNPRILRASKR